jgi:hypothetical protein
MRRISFPARLDLSYQFMRGVGVREAVLLAVAVGQAIWLIFLVDSLAFVSRLVMAVVIAVALIAIATVPIKGYKVEQYAVIVIRGMLRPKVYLHQTARAAEVEIETQPIIKEERQEKKEERAYRPARDVAPGEWAAPNVLAVMLLFVALMVVSSLLLYLVSGGELPGVREVAGAVEGTW